MRIIVTNDDGYRAKGLQALVRVLRRYGDITLVAPKHSQSGMSMAVSMGYKPLAVKHIGQEPGLDSWYLDGTPASCVKFALDNILYPERADLVVSGINHGSNASTAALYSGTLGAAMEGVVNGVPGIGVSLDTFDHDADFSAVESLLPGIIDSLLPFCRSGKGTYYNINFPVLPVPEIKGVKACNMGMGHWEKEYRDFFAHLESAGRKPTERDMDYIGSLEPGEEVYVMAGDYVSTDSRVDADQNALADGWITVTPHNIDTTDYEELGSLCVTF